MEREDKMKMTCSPEQLAEILRSMADAMERGRLSLDTVELDWNSVEKISLTIRNAAGMADGHVRATDRPDAFVVDDRAERRVRERTDGAVSGPHADIIDITVTANQ